MEKENFILNSRWDNGKSQSRIMVMSIYLNDKGEEIHKELAWNTIKIHKSLDEICHTVELGIPFSERDNYNKHDRIEVRLYNPYINESEGAFHTRRITTVLIDEIIEVYDAHRKNISIVGRSPARDIIDSSWSGGLTGHPSLEEIVVYVAERFNMKVARKSIGSPPTDPVFSFSWESESPWTKIIQTADNQGFIFTSAEDGNLYLWKVATNIRGEREPGNDFKNTSFFHLSEGMNVRSIQVVKTGAEQFHEYIVKGNGKEAKEIDNHCKNNRIHTVNISDPMISQQNLNRRALTEMRRRQGNKLVVNVSGWNLQDEQIKKLGETKGKELFWNPNFLVPVDFPSIHLKENLLISEVEYTADKDSMTCQITLVDREVYL